MNRRPLACGRDHGGSSSTNDQEQVMIIPAWRRVIPVVWVVLGSASFADAQISIEAVAGRPFGVASIEYRPRVGRADAFANGGVLLTEKDGRVLYPAIEGTFAGRLLGSLRGGATPQGVSGYFLFRGDGPLDLTLHAPNEIRVKVTPVSSARVHARLMRRYWRTYSSSARQWARENSYPGQVENYLITMLSRRLGVTPPTINRGWSTTEQMDTVLGTADGYRVGSHCNAKGSGCFLPARTPSPPISRYPSRWRFVR